MKKITVPAVKRRLARYRQGARAALIERLEGGGHLEAPVDFRAWLKRRAGRKASGFPDAWRVDPQLEISEPAKVAVLLHVFFPELVPEILARLGNIPVAYDLFITNASGEDVRVPPGIANMRNVAVLKVDNRGRDIFPSVQVVNSGALDPYELILKVHTKRSAWREGHTDLAGDGAQWKDSFLDALLGSESKVKAILSAFAANPDLGQVTAPGSVLGPEFWGADKLITAELLRRLELDLNPDTLRFCAGSMYWTRAFVLQGLRALNLTRKDFDKEPAPIDGTTAHAVERAIGILTTEAGLRLEATDTLDRDDDGGWARFAHDAPRQPAVSLVPFYLPQFHPVPENDRWWGRGFTEWTNVTAAHPVYLGHYQPRLPTDLGFYDLRLDEVRELQAAMARNHGIAGFMYYYYWFSGERLLERPIEALRASDLDFPYCIMWANENWTRRWDGRSSDILIGQDYHRVPAESFIDDVLEFLSDPRYVRVVGRPLLAVYRPGQMVDFPSVVAHWRRRAREHGLGELLVLSVDVAEEFDGLGGGARAHGLDGRLGFPPHNLPWKPGPSHRINLHPDFRGNVMSYQELVKDAITRLSMLDDHDHPGVMVTFDNTARRQWKPDLWYGSNPYTFHRWLAAAASAVMDRPPGQRVVFINAWNEWAEGAVLEPNDRHGRTFLQAVRSVAHR